MRIPEDSCFTLVVSWPVVLLERIVTEIARPRALEYIAIAREEGGGDLYTSFIAFKICLVKADSLAACKELSIMTSCADFTPDFLTVRLETQISTYFP